MIGAGLATGTVLATFHYTTGIRPAVFGDPNEDEVDRKERMKKQRRRPIEETVEQLGEGRGKPICIRYMHAI
jgi:hypothetical protein